MSKLGMSLFRKVPVSLLEFRHDATNSMLTQCWPASRLSWLEPLTRWVGPRLEAIVQRTRHSLRRGNHFREVEKQNTSIDDLFNNSAFPWPKTSSPVVSEVRQRLTLHSEILTSYWSCIKLCPAWRYFCSPHVPILLLSTGIAGIVVGHPFDTVKVNKGSFKHHSICGLSLSWRNVDYNISLALTHTGPPTNPNQWQIHRSH